LVQNAGVATLHVQVPPGSHRQAVEVDGRAAELRDDGKAGLLVPLPETAALVRVRVEYTTTAPPLRSWGRLELPQPRIDLPVLRTSWRVALPEGYVADQLGKQPISALRFGIGERLFGSWYRQARTGPTSASPFAGSESASLPPTLQRQLEALRERLSQPQATWGQALLDHQLAPEVVGDSPPALWIDALAVAEAGVEQNSAVVSAGESRGSLEALLSQVNLALLVGERAMILTSLPVARHYRQAAVVSGELPIARIDDRWLATCFDDPQLRFSELVTPQIWASPYALGRVERHGNSEDRNAALQTASQVLELDAANSQELAVTIYRRDWLAGLRIATMLVGIGLAWLAGVNDNRGPRRNGAASRFEHGHLVAVYAGGRT
jgi:hypothetical protein